MRKLVLVTGAYGFIGRNASLYFAEKGCNVVGIGHGIWSIGELTQWGISKWHTMDITTEALLAHCESPDVIVHCAGSGSVAYSLSNPGDDFKRTVDSTLAVLEFARLKSPQAALVYPSSGGVYGDTSKLPMAEHDQLFPASPYGVHKCIAEKICVSYAKHFNIPISIVRLFSVYGSGLRKQLLWDVCNKIKNNDNIFYGTGQESRDWIHISDAVSLIFEASIRASIACPIVNGGSGQRVSVSSVVNELYKVFGSTNSAIFSGKVRAGDPVHYEADTTKLEEWGWRASVDWRGGIRDYAKWYISKCL